MLALLAALVAPASASDINGRDPCDPNALYCWEISYFAEDRPVCAWIGAVQTVRSARGDVARAEYACRVDADAIRCQVSIDARLVSGAEVHNDGEIYAWRDSGYAELVGDDLGWYLGDAAEAALAFEDAGINPLFAPIVDAGMLRVSDAALNMDLTQ